MDTVQSRLEKLGITVTEGNEFEDEDGNDIIDIDIDNCDDIAQLKAAAGLSGE